MELSITQPVYLYGGGAESDIAQGVPLLSTCDDVVHFWGYTRTRSFSGARRAARTPKMN